MRICIIKNKDIDKFREELNNDIDKIIEEDESEKERVKPSHIFLTISIVCLVFGYLKGFCILGFVLGCIWFLQMKSKYLRNRKRKKIQIRF